MEGARRLEEQVRVGLDRNDDVIQQPSEQSTRASRDPLEVVSFGKTVRRHVRDFGLLFCLIGCGVGAWKLYREAPIAQSSLWIAGGLIFGSLGMYAPRVLLPVWRGWMKLAHYLSIVMTSVLLSATWCIGFVPMALILKCCGIRRMNLTFKDGASSYWETRDTKYDDFQRMKLQY